MAFSLNVVHWTAKLDQIHFTWNAGKYGKQFLFRFLYLGFPYLLISFFFFFSLGWSGILIEADPDTYKKLADRGRKSWNLPVCLSTKPYPIQVVNQLS